MKHVDLTMLGTARMVSITLITCMMASGLYMDTFPAISKHMADPEMFNSAMFWIGTILRTVAAMLILAVYFIFVL